MVRLVLFPGVVLDGAAGVDVCPSIAILVRDDLALQNAFAKMVGSNMSVCGPGRGWPSP